MGSWVRRPMRNRNTTEFLTFLGIIRRHENQIPSWHEMMGVFVSKRFEGENLKKKMQIEIIGWSVFFCGMAS